MPRTCATCNAPQSEQAVLCVRCGQRSGGGDAVTTSIEGTGQAIRRWPVVRLGERDISLARLLLICIACVVPIIWGASAVRAWSRGPVNGAAGASGGAATTAAPLTSPIKRAQGVPTNKPVSGSNPLGYVTMAGQTRDKMEGIVAANNLRQFASGFQMYRLTHDDRMPDTLADLGVVLGDVAALLANPRTGENPGFLYEKPARNAPPDTVIMWELWQGQKDPGGATLRLDGSIR